MSRTLISCAGSSRSLSHLLWGCGDPIGPNFQPLRGSVSRERLQNAPAVDATAHLGRRQSSRGLLLIFRLTVRIES